MTAVNLKCPAMQPALEFANMPVMNHLRKFSQFRQGFYLLGTPVPLVSRSAPVRLPLNQNGLALHPRVVRNWPGEIRNLAMARDLDSGRQSAAV